MVKVLVLGANGMLGHYVVRYLSSQGMDVTGLTRSDFNIMITPLVDLPIASHNYVINCAGAIPQRRGDIIEMSYINGIFPVLLAEKCEQLGVRLIHITTDCVFSGKKGDYTENDEHDAADTYGTSKSAGERHKGQMIRTSIVGEEVKNKVSLLEWVRKHASGSSINGYINHHWNGVTCLQLAKVIYLLITENITWQGVRHLFSPTKVSKCELIELMNRVYNLHLTVVPTVTESIDKTLSTIYSIPWNIPELRVQLEEQRKYGL